MNAQRQAEEGGGLLSVISGITNDTMNEIAEINPDMFDETAHWTEDDAALLEFDRGDSSDEDGLVEDNENEDVPPQGETASGSVGIDKLSEAVRENLGEDYYNALKGIQAQYTRDRQSESELRASQDEVATLKAEMSGIVAEWNALKDEATDDEDYDEGVDEDVDELSQEAQGMYENMSPAHKRLFGIMLRENGTEWAKDNGYVRMEDVEQRETQKQQVEERRTVLVSAVDQGMEKYGELFGYRDAGGKFVPNAELKGKMTDAYNFLGGNTFKGTLLDVFEYGCKEEIFAMRDSAPQVRPTGVDELLAKRVRASQGANGSSSGKGAPPNLYDNSRNEKGRRRMTIADVAKRAARHTMLTT